MYCRSLLFIVDGYLCSSYACTMPLFAYVLIVARYYSLSMLMFVYQLEQYHFFNALFDYKYIAFLSECMCNIFINCNIRESSRPLYFIPFSLKTSNLLVLVVVLTDWMLERHVFGLAEV